MKSWPENCGHVTQRSILDKHIANKTWSQAYLFYGPPGAGKRMIAESFAGKILDVPHGQSDIQILDAAEQGGSVEFVRHITPLLHQKSITGRVKISIIDHAETLSNEAQNAFLKILEEPKPDQILILISATKSLLPTLLSRLTLIHFNRPKLTAHFGETQDVQRLVSGPVFQKLLQLYQMADLESGVLAAQLEASIVALYATTLSDISICGDLQKLAEARQLLRKNVNKKLVLQHIVL